MTGTVTSGAVATLPVAVAPIGAGVGGIPLPVPTVPCTTAPLIRLCSTVAISRIASTDPFAVCPPVSLGPDGRVLVIAGMEFA